MTEPRKTSETVEDVCLLDSTEFHQEDSALLQDDDKSYQEADSQIPLLLETKSPEHHYHNNLIHNHTKPNATTTPITTTPTTTSNNATNNYVKFNIAEDEKDETNGVGADVVGKGEAIKEIGDGGDGVGGGDTEQVVLVEEEAGLDTDLGTGNFNEGPKCGSQYGTVDSQDSVRFAEHTTVFTVPRLKLKQRNNTPNKENSKLLKCSVVALFILILAGFISVRVLHAKQKEAILVGRLIHFSENERKVQLLNRFKEITLTGWLGSNFTSSFHFCQPKIKDQSIQELCYQSQFSTKLKIIHEEKGSLYCYSIKWEVSKTEQFLDCYEIDSSNWYGMNVGSKQSWPLKNFSTDHISFSTETSNVWGSVLEPLWVSSDGVGIFVNDSHPFGIRWNSSGDGLFCLLPDLSQPYPHKQLHYYLCQGTNITDTYINIKKIFLPVDQNEHSHNDNLLKTIIWSFEEKPKNISTQSHIFDFLKSNSTHIYNDTYIELNSDWQESQGDFRFNTKQFPNVTEFLQEVEHHNISIIYPISPYFHFTSKEFRIGMMSRYFIRDAVSDVTRLVKWHNKQMAIVDVSNPNASKWYLDKLLRLSTRPEFGGFRNLAIGQSYIPQNIRFFNASFTVRNYIDKMASFYRNSSEVFYYDSKLNKHQILVIDIESMFVRQGNHTCINNVIDQALTVSMLGYPYITVSPSAYPNITQELYMRYISLASFMPVLRLSYSKHLHNRKTFLHLHNLIALHQKLVSKTIEGLTADIKAGLPIIRPLWWVDPTDKTTLNISDQFLIGSKLMVAPYLCGNIHKRDIYIPAGRWKDLQSKVEIQGKTWFYNYPTEKNFVAIFQHL
ncbi:myogenesis-regulating glycosidase-like [Argonauta hians]